MKSRWSEPSTWAGVGVLLSSVVPALGPLVGLSGSAVTGATAAGAAIAAAVAVLKREGQ